MGWILFLLGLGLLLLLLELFVTPGVVVGILGILAWFAALWQVYSDYGTSAGNWTTLGMIFLLVASVVWGLKTNVWKKVTIHTNITGKSNEIIGFVPQIGLKGKSVSMLRPTGSARFENTVFEVVTRGEMIDPGAEIEIIEIENRKIYVKKI